MGDENADLFIQETEQGCRCRRLIEVLTVSEKLMNNNGSLVDNIDGNRNRDKGDWRSRNEDAVESRRKAGGKGRLGRVEKWGCRRVA